MKQINKRLDDLEHSTKPVRGCVVLWSDLDQVGEYWRQLSKRTIPYGLNSNRVVATQAG